MTPNGDDELDLEPGLLKCSKTIEFMLTADDPDRGGDRVHFTRIRKTLHQINSISSNYLGRRCIYTRVTEYNTQQSARYPESAVFSAESTLRS